MRRLKYKPKNHQIPTLKSMSTALKDNDSVVLFSGTGTGKTYMAAYMINALYQRGYRCVFTAPYVELVTQTRSHMIDYGIPEDDIGVIWADAEYWMVDEKAPIQIASIDSLANRDYFGFDYWFIDEAHIRRVWLLHYINMMVNKVDSQGKPYTPHKQVKFIGLSATPFSAWMGNFYQTMVRARHMHDLIKEGALSKYVMLKHGDPEVEDDDDSGSDYTQEKASKAMSKVINGDIPTEWFKHASNLPTICFALDVGNAGAIKKEFDAVDVRCAIVTAATPRVERNDIFSDFDAGIVKVIVNVGVLIAGFDRDVRCVLFCAATRNRKKWIQALGRGLRTAEGKEACIIIDFSGTWNRLGNPDDYWFDDLCVSSDGFDANASKEAQESETEETMRSCPSCKLYHSRSNGNKCPRCGHEFFHVKEVKFNRDVELTVAGSNDVAVSKSYTQKEKQQIYSELRGLWMELCIKKNKNYKETWINYKYRDYTGSYPHDIDTTLAIRPSGKIKAWHNKQIKEYFERKEKANEHKTAGKREMGGNL